MHTSLKPQNGRRHGIALVIVLAMLVLLSGLLVAFLSTATIERSASYSYASSTSARQIADSTVSFAIGHIREATSVADEDGTWASQPGAIRTFHGSLSTNRKPLRDNAAYDGYSPSSKDAVYKLYSSDRMKVKASEYVTTDLPEETDVIEKWDRREPPPAGYVDLNEPLVIARRDINPDGTVVEPRYPIIDPRAALSKSEGPASAGNPSIVEGFDAKIVYDEKLKLPSGSFMPYLPMPVKWLYVFNDGTMGPSSLATEDNPIVGRTAFWADDETCKLNINTASEGTFWDTPSVSTMQECGVYGKSVGVNIPSGGTNGLNLASSQPVQGEYQRYPGHPATTCLSPVLGWLWNITPTSSIYPYAGSVVNKPYQDFKNAIYEISPFIPTGNWTSQGALRNTDIEFNRDQKLDIRTKHLYASVDELLFKSQRFSANTISVNSPDKLNAEALERARFFLTANSRAPELNLSSRPRVTIWPVNADFRYRTSFDDLFIFASTIAKSNTGSKDKGYYFLREDAKSPVVDFTGNFKSGFDDQNVRMYSYLQWLTDRPVPGFGGTFADNLKFGGPEGRDHMLLMMFDYVRTVNINDTGASTRLGNVFAPYTPRFYTKDAPDDQYARYDRSVDWSGQVTPLRRSMNDRLVGMGRFILPSEISVIFHGTNDPGPTPGPAGSRYIRATMAFEMATVMPGYPCIRETYWTRVVPHPTFRDGSGRSTRPAKIRFVVDNENHDVEIDLCGNPQDFANGLINIPNVSSHEVAQGRGYMPMLGFMTAWYGFKEHKAPGTLLQEPHLPDPNRYAPQGLTQYPQPKKFGNYFPDSRAYTRDKTVLYYPYVSKSIILPKTQKEERDPTSFQILDLGAYRLEIYVGESPEDPRSKIDGQLTPVQTVDFQFPQQMTAALPVPPAGSRDMELRLRPANGGNIGESDPSQFIEATDVVRSLEFTGPFRDNKAGDLRIGAVLSSIPDTYYTPVADVNQNPTTAYASSTPRMHRLLRSHGDPDREYFPIGSGNIKGLLVPGQRLRTDGSDKPPILPAFVTGVTREDGGPGDFDRGLSKHVDGAFGNKVDEGNLKFDRTRSDYTGMPYYRGRGIEETGQTYFSPNRQLCSAVMFGSIPSGVGFGTPKPWQTLLFRPSRESNKLHPGADVSKGPPDHLLLDLFHMPVVEPYAISEPFSTMGKVNMNYVIAPFGYAKGDNGNNPDTQNPRSYIRRDTALRGTMKSTFVMAVPSTIEDSAHRENPQAVNIQLRYPIHMNRTMEEFETRLKSKDEQYALFRSASEICTIDLYPSTSPTTAPNINWNTYWTTNGMTGDNMRERPYAHIFPRLTTKSNVYTVHMRCQAIRQGKRTKNKNGEPQSQAFNPDLDQVVAEYRGSATVERFIDPNDEALRNYNERTQRVDPLYRYRIVNTKHFTPR
jgi:hypothetical protein